MDRFWAKVRKDGPVLKTHLGPCWPWQGSVTDGYGRFLVGSRTTGRRAERSHRVALTLKLGRPIAPGMRALHLCDHTLCCNPDHLYEGTDKENVADQLARGQYARSNGPRGGKHRFAKLTVRRVRGIIDAVTRRGFTRRAAAEKYDVSPSHVGRILRGEVWRGLV